MATASYYTSENQHQFIKLILKCIVIQASLVCYLQKDFCKVLGRHDDLQVEIKCNLDVNV